MDFEIPGLDLSFHSVLVITKQFLGLQEMKIAGEFVCSPPDLGWTCPGRENIRLRLRIIGGSKDDFIDLHNLSSKTFSRYFTEAAEKVLLLLDPYTLARHYYLRSLKCKTVDELLHCYESKEGYQKEAERIASMLTEPSGKFRGLGFELRALLATQFRPDAFVDELFKKAVHNAPSDLKAQVLNSWGVVLSRRDDYQAAIEKYRTSIKYKTDFAVAYQNWGYALAQQGAYREAYDRYTKAIKIEPDYAIAYYNRGISLRRLCAFERAADDYRTAVEIDQDYRVAYSALGFVLRRLQRFEEGDVAYERAVELDSDAARTLLNWGVLWLDFAEYKRRNGDLQGASTAIVKSEKILERSLNVDPEYDRAHFYMGRLQELGGDFESALRSYKDGLGREIRDDDDKSALAEVHSKLASVLIKVGGAADAEAHRSASEQLIASVQVHEPCR